MHTWDILQLKYYLWQNSDINQCQLEYVLGFPSAPM